MKIAYVVTRGDSVGGATIHIRDLASALREQGHEVVVLAGGSGAAAEQFESVGLPFRPLRHLRRPISPARDLAAFRELAGALREIRPDLVSTHTAKAGWIGRAACARLGIPCIYTPHGWAVTDRISRAGGLLFRFAERWAARWSDAIVCVCENERKIALEHGIGEPEQLIVVHNGVRPLAASFSAHPGMAPVRIVSIARFEAPKDHAALLAALGTLRELDWSLDFVGDGPLEGAVRREVRKLGLGGRVSFLGYQPDPAAILSRAQIFVLSSRSEGFPRSILEAMRAGLPVVASDVGGVAEAVEHGRTGFLCPRGDVRSLAASIKELITSASVRQRFGEAAHLRYKRRFRLELMVDQTVGIYNTVLARNTQTIGIR